MGFVHITSFLICCKHCIGLAAFAVLSWASSWTKTNNGLHIEFCVDEGYYNQSFVPILRVFKGNDGLTLLVYRVRIDWL